VKTGISPDPYGGGDVGLFYHQQSSLGPRGLLRSLAGWGSRPAPYKAVAGGAAVALPAARPLPELSVGQALYQRRSLRRYRDRMLTAQELAWLVHASTAITSGDGYRTAPHRQPARCTRSKPTWRSAGSRASTPACTTSTSGRRPSSRYAPARSPVT
jgi:hypothetical protein